MGRRRGGAGQWQVNSRRTRKTMRDDCGCVKCETPKTVLDPADVVFVWYRR